MEANVGSGNLTNATAIGAYAKVSASNTIQLGADGTGGSTAVTNVKTSGTLTAGTVTYPNAHGSNGQILSTTGSGTLTWTAPPSGGVTTISGGTTGLTPATATSGTVTLAGTLVAANGGTGQSTYAIGDILYASAANTLSKLTKGSDGQVLTLASGIPSWGSNGLYSLNGVTASAHTFATPSNITTSDIGWSSNTTTGVHTLNIPDARTDRRGVVNLTAQTFVGDKTFQNDIIANGIYLGRGNNSTITNNLSIGVGNKNFSTNTQSGAQNNIAIGGNALTSLADGYKNNAVGNGALFNTNGGYQNNAFGFEALKGNTTGDFNSGFGESALLANSTGNHNTAVGYNSLISTTGSENTAIGSTSNVAAGKSNSTAIGYGASVSADNTIQLGNTSVTSVITSGTLSATGAIVGTLRVTGGAGTAGRVLTSDASGNATWATASAGITGVGTITTTSYAAGATVSANSLILAAADGTNGGVVTTGTQTFAGAKTFNSDIVVNTITVGRGKTSNGTSNEKNIAIGLSTLNANTTGIENTAVGHRALISNTTGSSNLAFGTNSLAANTTGSNNTAMGNSIMTGNTGGGGNTGVGSGALQSNTNNNNTAIGYASLLNNNGGNNNTAVGVSAMQNNVSGTHNTAVGVDALKGTTGTYNTAIGFNARVLDGSTVTNATAIGNDANVSASNTIQLGNASVTDVKTSGKITAAGAEFSKAVTNSVAFNAGGSTSIDFSNSNLAYTSASPGNTFTLTGMKNGGTYTLAVQGTTSGTAGFTISGFTNVFLGNYASISGKETVYTFIVMGVSGSGGKVYISMVSQQ
jgi:hypothetical protein